MPVTNSPHRVNSTSTSAWKRTETQERLLGDGAGSLVSCTTEELQPWYPKNDDRTFLHCAGQGKVTMGEGPHPTHGGIQHDNVLGAWTVASA